MYGGLSWMMLGSGVQWRVLCMRRSAGENWLAPQKCAQCLSLLWLQPLSPRSGQPRDQPRDQRIEELVEGLRRVLRVGADAVLTVLELRCDEPQEGARRPGRLQRLPS